MSINKVKKTKKGDVNFLFKTWEITVFITPVPRLDV